jgi:glyoxylase-like metal-dependent hydrolase (beta-lactamase superfamily II)
VRCRPERSQRALHRAALALIFLTGPGSAQPPDPIPAPALSREAAMSDPTANSRMIEHARLVAPHIHMLTAPATSDPAPLANEILIEQTDGLVLLDAGKTRGAGKRIVALIRSLSDKPVKAIILTHEHPDHVMGLGPIVETWPNVEIVASARTNAHLLKDDAYRRLPRALSDTAERDGARAAALEGYAKEDGPHLHDPTLSEEERRGWARLVGVLALRIADEQGSYLVLPTRTLTDRYVLPDPVAPVEVRFIGAGHTDGDVIAWMPRQHVAAAGDMVVAPIPFGSTNMLDWPATLRKLRSLDPRAIVPGHGPILPGLAYLDRLIALLDHVVGEARRLSAGPPLSDAQILARADLSRERAIFAGNDKWRAYWFDQYVLPDVVEACHELGAAEARRKS